MFKTITNKALFAATLSIICLTICCTFTSAKFNARAETTAQTVALNEIGKESPNNKRGNAMKAVYKDKEYDLAAEHVLGGETEVVIEVVDSSGVPTRLTEQLSIRLSQPAFIVWFTRSEKGRNRLN